MGRDIGLRLSPTGNSFDIVNQDPSIPEELQAAITLLFFSNDFNMRGNFNGLYNLVGNSNAVQSIELDLADISFKLTEALKETYPHIASTRFEVTINGSYINVQLTINTDKESITDLIYSREL